MDIGGYRFYYFLGIGGIGMSALARYFRHEGKEVAGYDRTPSAITESLSAEGISCSFEDAPGRLEQMLAPYAKDEVLVVVTPAIPAENRELEYIRSSGVTMMKRSQVLGEISRRHRTIAIGGTHGKTTTTTLVTHLLHASGIPCTSFMGGISGNYNTNLLLSESKAEDTYMVVEADEYDRSFLTLHPHIAVITSVDADHLDIYGSGSTVVDAYSQFAAQVKEDGVLIVKKNVDNELRTDRQSLTYAINLDSDYCAKITGMRDGEIFFDVQGPDSAVTGAVLGLPGMHNVENATAAVAVALQVGLSAAQIKSALRSFKGVKRRFDVRVKSGGMVYIDDYAHHPTELRAAIGSARQLYAGKKITGVFQPHLFSRTRDFAGEFAESLEMLDECVLLEIYPAREKPIGHVTSAWLRSLMKDPARVRVLSKEALLDWVRTADIDVLMTMGAGDIDRLVAPIERILIERIEKDQL